MIEQIRKSLERVKERTMLNIYRDINRFKPKESDETRATINVIQDINRPLSELHVVAILNGDSAKIKAELVRCRGDKIGLTEEKIANILKAEDLTVKAALVKNKKIKLNDNHINEILKSENQYLMFVFLEERDNSLTQKQISDLFDHPSEHVKSALIKRSDVPLSKQKVQSILDSGSYLEILALLSRSEISITDKQIENGVKSENDSIKMAFIEKDVPLTQEQVRVLSGSESQFIKMALNERKRREMQEHTAANIHDVERPELSSSERSKSPEHDKDYWQRSIDLSFGDPTPTSNTSNRCNRHSTL